MIYIISSVTFVVGFIIGILFGRKNKNLVEQSVNEAKEQINKAKN